MISTTRPAPVAIVLPNKAMATFPPARFSPMMPEPITMASSSAVPRASAANRRGRSKDWSGGSKLGSGTVQMPCSGLAMSATCFWSERRSNPDIFRLAKALMRLLSIR